MLRKILPLFFILFVSVCEPKLPTISANDIHRKTEEILNTHVTHKQLNATLTKRIIQNFLEELDPIKSYLIETDIQEWTNPSDALAMKVLQSIKKGDYSFFDTVHDTMLSAIERRRQLELEVESSELPQKVNSEEFKNIPWAKSKQELLTRLLRIKAIQIEAAEKLSAESKSLLFEQLKKRRLLRENEIKGATAEERKLFTLTHILKAICSSLDSHTTYFTPSEANQFMFQVQQRLVGIGAQLRDNLNGFSIVRLIDGGPACKSNKLKINDLIIAVNKEPVVGMDITEAVELIRGEKGTTVLLTVLRDTTMEQEKQSQKLDIEIIRGEVVLEEERFDTSIEPYADGVIARIALYSFYQDPTSSSAQDLKKTIENLKKEHNLKGIVLDLRNNSGGLLPQAVAVTGLFIKKGIVVSIKDSSGNIQHLRNTEDKMTWDGPLVVLSNRATASASEIVAQTLQDYGRAYVVGDKQTFGKGTFQTYTLDTSHNSKVNPQGEYKVTRGRYYTVSGKSPQLIGVQADIEIPGILSELDIGEEFVKFPLENDAIEPHFEDDLSDVPPEHRKRINFLYKHNMQQKMNTYTQYFDVLKKNSQKRIETNKNYQNFLKEIKNKHFDSDKVEIYGQTDLQLTETYNIIKDLIFLLEINHNQAIAN